MGKHNIFLWGDLCIDKNDIAGQKIISPGGSSFYFSKTLKILNNQPVIISPRGKDYNMAWLGNIPVFPEKPLTKNTLVYQNNYDSQGNRTLYAKNRDCAFFIDPDSVPEEQISRAKAIIVCPIDNNVSYLSVKKLRQRIGDKTILACLPQGFFRRYEDDGKVYQAEWKDDQKIVPFFDMIFLSEEDGENLDQKALFWNELGSSVIITRAEKGCSVFEKNNRMDFPAFFVEKVIDPVGAGDIFSAAFISNWLIHRNINKAAIFANATAALSLSFHGLEMDIDIKKINKLISSNLRN